MSARFVHIIILVLCLALIPVWSSPASASSPEAPSQLTATTISSDWIRLDWADESDSELGFKIERRLSGTTTWTQIAVLHRANLTAYVDTCLLPGTTYHYRVRAYNAQGNSPYSNIATSGTPGKTPEPKQSPPVLILSPPEAPSSLTVKTVSLTWIDKPSLWLNWEDNSITEAGFRIYRRTTTGSWTLIAEIGPNVTHYVDTCLPHDITYLYRVSAFNVHGSSPLSNTASGMSAAPVEPEPDPPEPEEPETVVIRLFVDQTGYYVNDVLKEMDVSPIIRHGRTLLPIRYIADNIGAAISWDPVERKAMVTLGETTVELWLDQNQARINGIMVPLDQHNPDVVPISIPPGRTMLPLRFVAEALGCKVDWHPLPREAVVTYPEP